MSDEHRAQQSPCSAATNCASEPIRALALLYSDFVNTLAANVNVIIFRTPAVMKLLAHQFLLICLLKNARKSECGHDRDLPTARNVLLAGLPIPDRPFAKCPGCQSTAQGRKNNS